MARSKKRQPYDPNKIHDRRSNDLLRNAMVAPIDVDDPLALEPGDKIRVLRSVRNDPLANLHARKSIDEAQYEGGRSFQRDFETAERGPRAIDPSKEAVDGGTMPEPITEGQRKAALKLKQVYTALGQDGSALVHDVLIHGHTYRQVANARGLAGERWENFFGMSFQMCLHKLSYIYGFATEKTGKQRMPCG